MILITNNPKVKNDETIRCLKEYVDGSYRDVLIAVRDRVHKGHKLLSHPLSGSVKPNETPYKSVLISKEAGDMDLDSLQIIEDSIAVCDKFMKSPVKYGHNICENSESQILIGESARILAEQEPKTQMANPAKAAPQLPYDRETLLEDFSEVDYELIAAALAAAWQVK